MLSADNGRMHLRFVSGRPERGVTTDFLEWLCEQIQAQGKQVLVLIWDNASWHGSQAGQNLAARAQSNRAARRSNWRNRRAHHSMLVAHQSPWLNRTLAKVGPWETSACRTCSAFDHEGTPTARL